MIIDKINNKVSLDDLVLREEPETFTRWQDPTIEEYKKEISRLKNMFDELETECKECKQCNIYYRLKKMKEGKE